jgi:hypothetical protein
MKRELMLAFMALFLMSLTAITGVYAIEADLKPIELISKQEDITGEGKKDYIQLQGIPFSEDEKGFQEFILTVKLSDGHTYEDQLEYGIDPKLKLVDLNHDGIKDIFIDIPTDQNEDISNHYLYSAKNHQFSVIPIPDLQLQGQFSDDYKATVSIPSTKQTFEVDLKQRKEQYDALGIYQDGKLNEPTELTILPYEDLKPLMNEEGEKYGLRGIQKIGGTSDKDGIAFIESTWFYLEDEWKLVHTSINKIDSK